ncbi:MAG: HU family DNA-binding protein [Dermatophilaceae bacterium]
MAGGRRRERHNGVCLVNKADLVQAVEDRLGSRKMAVDAVEVVLETIVREVAKGNRVSLTGFGTFEKVARAPRTGRNPRTGETVKIRKTSVPRFSASVKFKDYVKTPKSMPKAGPLLARASASSAPVAAAAKPVAKRATKATTAAAPTAATPRKATVTKAAPVAKKATRAKKA